MGLVPLSPPQGERTMASPQFPEPPAGIEPSTEDAMDRALQKLSANKGRWVGLNLSERISLLEKLKDRTLEQAERWVELTCQAQGQSTQDGGAGGPWLGGPVTTMRNISLLIDTLKSGGQPKPPRMESGPGGRTIAHVYPQTLLDRILMPGILGEVWLQAGQPATQGRFYREGGEGAVALVLGAGNVNSIGPMDVLYKLYAEGEVCILKMNPVNEYIGPIIEKAFKPLIDEGFLAIVYGGADVGRYLTSHPLVETLHITGSDQTHDAIIWGDGAERERNKSAGEPQCSKPITSELGCVTPVIIVPGHWSNKELDYQARQIAGQVFNNGSFNCNAAKVLVTSSKWAQREEFLDRLRAIFKSAEPHKAYYPGAQQRYDAFMDQYPQAEVLGGDGEQVVPWTLIPNVPPETGEYALTHEAFCGLLCETSLPEGDPADFLRSSTTFCNESVWGNLSCSIVIDPRQQKKYRHALEEAVTGLRYGGVAVNVWPGMIYGLVTTTWGAYPDNPLDDIRSGKGVVHNSYLFDHPEKSVVRGPFVMSPPAVWAAGHRSAHQVGEKLTAFEHSKSIWKIPGLAISALKG